MSLKDIKFQSQNTFGDVDETADDTLYFVESVVITSVTKDGNTYVRVYSDNWCEEMGETAPVSPGSSIPVQLSEPMKDDTYIITITGLGTYAAEASANFVVISKSAGSFEIYNGSPSTLKFMWEAKGFIS